VSFAGWRRCGSGSTRARCAPGRECGNTMRAGPLAPHRIMRGCPLPVRMLPSHRATP
jgi:hypothetical protein